MCDTGNFGAPRWVGGFRLCYARAWHRGDFFVWNRRAKGRLATIDAHRTSNFCVCLDRAAVSAHLEKSGRTRALELLKNHPIAPPIDADGPQGRDWLIALEHYNASDGSDEDGMIHAGDDATASVSAWKRHHLQVAERRALRARVNEAAEEADQS